MRAQCKYSPIGMRLDFAPTQCMQADFAPPYNIWLGFAPPHGMHADFPPVECMWADFALAPGMRADSAPRKAVSKILPHYRTRMRSFP